METPREPALDIQTDVCPLFIVEVNESTREFKALDACGTGFLIAPELLVTCWHCVRAELDARRHYAITVRVTQDEWTARLLTNVSQDVAGRDLATARVEGAMPCAGLQLATAGAAFGADAWTFGYPLVERRQSPESGGPQFWVRGRYLEGYVTRHFTFEQPGFGLTPSYELDMKAPAGLSGAPLVRRPGREVLGVVYSETDVASIEAFASVDPETGERSPEVQRIVSFAVAHDTENLLALRGEATGGLELAEYVAQLAQPSLASPAT